MRGSDYCAWHSGLRAATDAAGRGESRLLSRMEAAGLLPLDLLGLPVWRDLTRLPRRDRSPMRLALVLAWDKRDREPLHWARMQRKAYHLAENAPRQVRQVEKTPWLANV